MTERSHKVLDKICQHCERILQYTSGMTQERLEADSKTLEAVVFNMTQIGELVRYVDDEVKEKNPEINWVAMRGLRNKIVHEYDRILPSMIWSTLKDDIPTLIEQVKSIKA